MNTNEIKYLYEIPNRYHFIEILEGISANEKHLSLLLLDVMRFSDVSAAFGYSAGDELLLKIVNKINRLFPNAAAIGRVSGDIFAIVFTQICTESSLRQEHAKLYNHFQSPMQISDRAFIADFNVGAAIRKNPETNINTLISLAESALKKSKSNSHEKFTMLNDNTRENTGRGLSLKADLRRALIREELELYYQVKVDLIDYSIIGCECLLRWNHPLDGVVFPGTLLQAAESYSMMSELGYWTLEKAIESIARLNVAGHEISVSVNLSPTQLYDPFLVQTLGVLLAKYNVQAKLLEIELTEDVALSNSLLVKRQLSEICHMGISVSMDDFGKGYSNLSFIRDIKLSAIKIDKAFVLDLTNSAVDCAIVQATKLISDAKNCDTYAEGIETIDQLRLLQEMGITKGQGFLFSRAVPFNELLNQLKGGDFANIVKPRSKKVV